MKIKSVKNNMFHKINSLIKMILVLLLFSSIVKAQEKIRIEKNAKTFEDSIYRVESTNKEMVKAMEKAKQTFREFEKALKSNNLIFTNFCIKKAFGSEKGDEYIWIKSIMFFAEKNKYVGIVGNVPQYTTKVKYDDIVEISKDEISDWMYLKNKLLKGGYTLRLLRSKMSDAERKAFDEESGFTFN